MKIKKNYLFVGGAVIILLLVILVIKLSFKDESAPVASTEGKVASFAPVNQPTIVDSERITGSTNAAVKVIVYEDYANAFSAINAENIKKLETEFGDKVVVAVRPYVTRSKSMSLEAAMAIECASEQDKWKEMREGIFRAVKARGLNAEGISGWAKQLGLDQDKFNTCLTDVEKQGIMLQVAEGARDFSVYGAPTVFINDELIVGARPYEGYTDVKGNAVVGLKTLVTKQLEK